MNVAWRLQIRERVRTGKKKEAGVRGVENTERKRK